MSNKLIKTKEGDAEILRFWVRAKIMARGTGHPLFHRVELEDEVEILSFAPLYESGLVCLLCKLQDGAIISIPIEWLKIVEE